ncbi:MAG: FtsX-like permease family protein [Roseiarcus sp.]
MFLTLLWVRGLLRRAAYRVFGAALGVALAVALVGSLGAFLDQSAATMTARSVASVPIDWQVQLTPSADPTKIEAAIRMAATAAAIHSVLYADTAGFREMTGGTTQTTGPGVAIAFDARYASDFPKEVRLLAGSLEGALLLQQTASNLHARPGDTVTIERVGLDPVDVAVAGVVDLPDADALFQRVGLPPGAAPQAPPDNVVILPESDWRRLFDPQTAAHPDATWEQFHVRLDHRALPADPLSGYAYVEGAARNLAARVAGQALVGDNLGARLDAVRGDALYARVLFLFLGLPGLLLAAALTVAVTQSHRSQRRIEWALLVLRGATSRQAMMMVAAEALTVAVIGVAFGLAITAILGLAGDFGNAARLPDLTTAGISILTGFILAAACIFAPAWASDRRATTASAGMGSARPGALAALRYYPDLILLALSGLVFWQLAGAGYQIVLAPEGVAATAVDYKAFIAPALFWAGASLLILRAGALPLAHRRRPLAAVIRPFAGAVTPAVAATLAHRARDVSMGATMLALAIAFAVSTAIFNTTYNAQARVDAELTNGADVTVFGAGAYPAGKHLDAIRRLPHAAAAEPMQHRFAYVGSDLQDLYGVDPRTIGRVTSLSDAYFAGGGAAEILALLAATPNGVLVSAETVTDFQLEVGDTINLRLLDASDHQYHVTPFKFIGVVREFPTAPKDSFLVANAAYVAAETHSDAAELVLVKAAGDPVTLGREAAALLTSAPGLRVSDIASANRIIGSSLTAVDLRGLTEIELGFAIAFSVAASGLLLILGFVERRRTFAILEALGATPGQMAAFIWSEGLYVLLAGSLAGGLLGVVIAWMLVKLLTGVFDPPPETLAWPAAYLAALGVAAGAATVVALTFAARAAGGAANELLRETMKA